MQDFRVSVIEANCAVLTKIMSMGQKIVGEGHVQTEMSISNIAWKE